MNLPDSRNGSTNWPKYALLTHAIELAMKAFVRLAIQQGRLKIVTEPRQHDLAAWYRLCLQAGLLENTETSDSVAMLSEMHATHFARYPQTGALADPSSTIDRTVDNLIFEISQITNPR